jgi:hypothetical protein
MNDSSKYFFERALELLHKKTFDSYRVNLHNPYTIFDELEKSIERLNKKRIKHFDPTITSIIAEAETHITNSDLIYVFNFGGFTQKQLSELLKSGKDGKRNRTLSLISKTICLGNIDFKSLLSDSIKDLLINDNDQSYGQIDLYTSWLITQLVFHGYSRKYILDTIRYALNQLRGGRTIEEVFEPIKNNFNKEKDSYDVIFKIKCSLNQELRLASNLLNVLPEFPNEFKNNQYVNEKFQEKALDEQYLITNINSFDFKSTLRKSLQLVSETIELNVLHDSENKIITEKQALIIHSTSRLFRFWPIEEDIDGFYQYQEDEFYRFIDNYKSMNDVSVAREKIKSAIRFYKLGNDSLEVEHKILNYWIGFEQLFSSVDTEEDSIKRIKSYFVAINAVFYWQRKTNYLLNSISRAGGTLIIDDLISANEANCDTYSPLLKTRYRCHLSRFNAGGELRSLLEQHIKRLEQHLTRIYRVRNELVHEGRSTVDLYLLAGHLRHYLLFSIEQITNELAENPTLDQIDDVFVYFETLLTRIKSANNIQEIFSIKQYRGYME